jgi:hypothetical protein
MLNMAAEQYLLPYYGGTRIIKITFMASHKNKFFIGYTPTAIFFGGDKIILELLLAQWPINRMMEGMSVHKSEDQSSTNLYRF